MSVPPVPPRPRIASTFPASHSSASRLRSPSLIFVMAAFRPPAPPPTPAAQPLAHLRDGGVPAAGPALDAGGEVGEVDARAGGHLGGGDVGGEVRLAEDAAVDHEDVDAGLDQGVLDIGVLG